MRLPPCVVLELGLALGWMAGGGFVGVRAMTLWRGEGSGSRAGRPPEPPGPLGAAAGLRPRQDLSGESTGELAVPPVDAPGTFLGMSDELLLDRLRTQPVTRLKLNRGGSSLSFRVDLADGSRAAWKPAQTNAQTVPRKEVAAYRLDRLLEIGAVPPATSRSISRDELFGLLQPESIAAVPRIRAETIVGPSGSIAGAASYWIPVIKDSDLDTPEGHLQIGEWLSQEGVIPFERRSFAAQMSALIVFDFLTANPDRYSGGNMKTSADGSRLFFMDNTMSFFLDPEGTEKNRLALFRTQRFSRTLLQALGRVDATTLRPLLRESDGTEILTDAEIRAVVQRRQFLQKYVAELARQFGDKNVLYFP